MKSYYLFIYEATVHSSAEQKRVRDFHQRASIKVYALPIISFLVQSQSDTVVYFGVTRDGVLPSLAYIWTSEVENAL